MVNKTKKQEATEQLFKVIFNWVHELEKNNRAHQFFAELSKVSNALVALNLDKLTIEQKQAIKTLIISVAKSAHVSGVELGKSMKGIK